MPGSFPSKVKPSPDVIYQTLDQEVVLLNMTNQRYFGLNDVGSDMWKLLVEHEDVEKVADRLCGDYDIDRATVQKDLAQLVQSLVAAGLLRAVDSGEEHRADVLPIVS